MKKYIAILLVLFTITITSCDLDTAPTGSVGPVDVFATTESARMAIRGISRLMVFQYYQTNPNFSGEGQIKLFHGDWPGNAMVRDMSVWAGMFNHSLVDNPAGVQARLPWGYYYRIIGEANAVLYNIDRAVGPEAERRHITAQALTYRAYSFFMLSQMYSKRWMDSNNGASRGVILRLGMGVDDIGFSTLAETYAQIYEDLKRAIDYFEYANQPRRGPLGGRHDININVARAILARAALTRQDWALAAEMAPLARAGYPLMNNEAMLAGFYMPTSEWIWSSFGSTAENMHWFTYHSHFGWNSPGGWQFGHMITRELFAQIPETDIRRNWWQPPVVTGFSPGNREDTVRPAGMTEAQAEAYFDQFVARIHADGFLPHANHMQPDGNSDRIAHYMQTKVAAGFGHPGVGHLLHIRSSEMVLVEAEARARMGQDAAAQNLLLYLNRDSGRNPSYTVTATDQALLEEIWLWRDIELWGEGFNWFDLKRTGRPLIRVAKADGGSFLPALTLSAQPNERNNWVFAIPNGELDFNRVAREEIESGKWD